MEAGAEPTTPMGVEWQRSAQQEVGERFGEGGWRSSASKFFFSSYNMAR